MKRGEINFDELIRIAIKAAVKAGAYINKKSNSNYKIDQKTGSDSKAYQVVTEVDRQAQAIILDELGNVNNQYDFGLLTEESEDDNSRFKKNFFWCIDPLDGTLPFTESLPGYAVSIALVSKIGKAVLGVVYDPVKDILYNAISGKGALKNEIPFKVPEIKSFQKFKLITDRSLLVHPAFGQVEEEWLKVAHNLGLEGFEIIKHGGAALNACWVIDHAPAIYFKFPKNKPGGGSIWDFAATSCIIKEAGGIVTDMYGDELNLNKKESTFMNKRGVIYASDEDISKFVISLYQTLNTKLDKS